MALALGSDVGPFDGKAFSFRAAVDDCEAIEQKSYIPKAYTHPRPEPCNAGSQCTVHFWKTNVFHVPSTWQIGKRFERAKVAS